MTEWLEETLPFAAWLPTTRAYVIDHREQLREHLQNTILGGAVVINVVVTVAHDHQPRHGHSPAGAEAVVAVLSWAMLLLTLFNCASWLYVHYFTLLQVSNVIHLNILSFSFVRGVAHL